MNAREMFEKLGYGYRELDDDDDVFQYSRANSIVIRFYKKEREFCSVEFFGPKNINMGEFKAIQQQLKELGWIEEEKNEIKQETNYEHYKDEILEYYGQNLAVVKGRPTLCCETNCNDCDFKINQIGCRETAKYWLKQPYKKPVFKLTKFEKELLECYSDECSFKLFNSLNGMKKKGYFKGIDDNEIIGDILENCEVVG